MDTRVQMTKLVEASEASTQDVRRRRFTIARVLEHKAGLSVTPHASRLGALSRDASQAAGGPSGGPARLTCRGWPPAA